MGKVTLSGASDDLIEVGGDIREEFNYLAGDEEVGSFVAFSDGTVLKIRFDQEGIWRVTPVVRGSAELKVDQATEDEYTDEATLDGDVRWAVHGIAFAKN